MGNRSNEQYALITDFDQNTSFSEAFHTLFANIRFNWEKHHDVVPSIHTMVITSATEYTERSAVTANLAIVAARSGYKTILVDADLRSSGLQQRFGLDCNTGLSDLLHEPSIAPQKVIENLRSTFIPGLQILCSGTASTTGSTLLLSPNLENCMECIHQVLEQTDNTPGIVIYHSSPVLTGPDASLITSLTEQVVLTIVAGRTTREQAKEAQEQLNQAHAKLVGAIIVNP
jgi:capsular exopolysaccharide synthesis family protein